MANIPSGLAEKLSQLCLDDTAKDTSSPVSELSAQQLKAKLQTLLTTLPEDFEGKLTH